MSDLAGATSIGEYLVSSRSFDEYRAMFALTDDDLRGTVLDCPGGGAAFTATARTRGVRAVAADPVYARPRAELADRLAAELERGSAWAAANADRYEWEFYGDPAGHAGVRAQAAEVFTADLLGGPRAYVAAALPALPFPDGSFDLVLSSHLLFTYADRLDAGFHRAALGELARVSRGVVRVYPLVDQAGRSLLELVERLTADLTADGLAVRVREVGYEFQRGARQLLELSAAGS